MRDRLVRNILCEREVLVFVVWACVSVLDSRTPLAVLLDVLEVGVVVAFESYQSLFIPGLAVVVDHVAPTQPRVFFAVPHIVQLTTPVLYEVVFAELDGNEAGATLVDQILGRGCYRCRKHCCRENERNEGEASEHLLGSLCWCFTVILPCIYYNTNTNFVKDTWLQNSKNVLQCKY